MMSRAEYISVHWEAKKLQGRKTLSPCFGNICFLIVSQQTASQVLQSIQSCKMSPPFPLPPSKKKNTYHRDVTSKAPALYKCMQRTPLGHFANLLDRDRSTASSQGCSAPSGISLDMIFKLQSCQILAGETQSDMQLQLLCQQENVMGSLKTLEDSSRTQSCG